MVSPQRFLSSGWYRFSPSVRIVCTLGKYLNSICLVTVIMLHVRLFVSRSVSRLRYKILSKSSAFAFQRLGPLLYLQSERITLLKSKTTCNFSVPAISYIPSASKKYLPPNLAMTDGQPASFSLVTCLVTF